MPSTNKTPFLGLNQWTPDNYPIRDDYNNDNVLIDAKMQSHDTQLSEIAINVKNFKCSDGQYVQGDGVHDDTTGIQNAVNACYANGGGTVYLPKGIYLLGTISNTTTWSLLNWKSNVNLVGCGSESILYAANGLNTVNNDFNFISTPDTSEGNAVNNCFFRDFVIDCNGVNNLVPNGYPSKKNAGIVLWYGDNIIVENVIVKNNAGRQCLSFGFSNHNFGEVIINKCKCENVGGSVAGNIYQDDHSSIYYEGIKLIVNNCMFTNASRGYACAIEIHADDVLVTKNIVDTFNVGINIAATVSNNLKNIYTNNIFLNMSTGINLWSSGTNTIKNTIIENNIIEIGDGSGAGISCSNVSVAIDGIKIRNNDITCIDIVSSYVGAGIYIQNVKDIIIKNNKIEGFMGSAIVVAPVDGLTVAEITENTITDCGKTSSGSNNYGIVFNSTYKFNLLKIEENIIENTSTTYMTYGITGNAPINNGYITNNRINNIPLSTSGIPLEIYLSGSITGNLLINHVGNGCPENILIASIGSKWIDMLQNAIYTKKILNNSSSGWRSERYASGIPSDNYRINDIIWNTNSVPNGNIGWVITGAGTSGTLSNITATTTSGSNSITVNSSSGLKFGTYITIAGVTGVFKIIGINNLTVLLDSNVNATVSNATVAYSTETYKAFGTISA